MYTKSNKLESIYNGISYTSRSHARWAIFFDLLNWKFVYQPNNFKFKDGTKYSPDFYLTKYETFVEVKNEAYINETYIKSKLKIAKEFKKPVLLLGNKLTTGSYFLFKPKNNVESGIFQINPTGGLFDEHTIEKHPVKNTLTEINDSLKRALKSSKQTKLSRDFVEGYFTEPYTLYLDEHKKYAWDSKGVKLDIPHWSSNPEYDSEGREFIILTKPNTLGNAFSIAETVNFKDDNLYYKKTFKNTYHAHLSFLKAVNIDNFQEYIQGREEPNFID